MNTIKTPITNLSELETHYQNSINSYNDLKKTGDESHLAYYKEKHPNYYSILKDYEGTVGEWVSRNKEFLENVYNSMYSSQPNTIKNLPSKDFNFAAWSEHAFFVRKELSNLKPLLNKEEVLNLYPNASIVHKPNSNYPYIVGGAFKDKTSKVEHYLSTNMQYAKTESEAWNNAKLWIDNTLGNPILHTSLIATELTKPQQEEHLKRLIEKHDDLVHSNNSILNSGSTILLTKNEHEIYKLSDAIRESKELFKVSNIGYGRITLQDLEKNKVGILLHPDSEFYTFNPDKKMTSFSNEAFNKLIDSKELYNDLVMINFETKHLAMTQSLKTGELKPIYLNEFKSLAPNEVSRCISEEKVGLKEQWMTADFDNDGFSNAEELINRTDPLIANIRNKEQLPEGTKFRVIPKLEENNNKYVIQKKHKIFGWRNIDSSENKEAILKAYNQLQTKEIKKNHSKKI